MLVCKKSSKCDGISKQADSRIQRGVGRRKLGEAGPVFLTRRKPSAFALELLAQADPVSPATSLVTE